MGTYIYKIRTKNTIEVEGLGETLEVHCAVYAYKPYHWMSGSYDARKRRYVEPEEINRRLHFQTGALSCNSAWKRRGDRPALVTLESAASIKENCTEWHRRGSGAPVYVYTGSNDPGYFSDANIGFELGWLYWSEHDQKFILQYRELDAFDHCPSYEGAKK